ncbi:MULTISPECIES: hypothetical protein [Legionella]|uniref:Uncharacterized protein n=1 Tax=Legionella resiliens TaxID=2905958 RepID=A0ABS8WZ51_9GAMM|nr:MULTISPECIES: hypothetical protein [unclassified Legionella]MCE0722628.1 hypothetical protein [Legionella sp. 9fVS26]MCE3531781.1 hypothetical protein [Legionella sp. 8cVS16]QLZ67850.1 hypothetical protein FOLKNPGA_00624 [Legionella sp. PC1000]
MRNKLFGKGVYKALINFCVRHFNAPKLSNQGLELLLLGKQMYPTRASYYCLINDQIIR